ncbi:MAG: glycolate oxidase subunit GlcE, partial [Pseudomonadota bacterium]
MDADIGKELQERVREAFARRAPLQISGGGSKNFYGRAPSGAPLQVGAHRGVIHYLPTELVITARAGTPLTEIETLLAEHRQMLPFEPPHFGPNATLGGAVACGLSGPRRPYSGALRDFVLGVKIINGKGDILRFGGQVMKNVAGFDVARLMAGALGTLGVLLEVSLKVLPRPEQEITLRRPDTAEQALRRMNAWAGQPLPLSAACFDGAHLYVRLSGTEGGLRAAREAIGGDPVPDGASFWEKLREQELRFFSDAARLWRLSLPPAAPPLHLPGEWFIDWGGAQRWLKNPLPAEVIRATAARLGGHATLFRDGERLQVFHPLPPALLA